MSEINNDNDNKPSRARRVGVIAVYSVFIVFYFLYKSGFIESSHSSHAKSSLSTSVDEALYAAANDTNKRLPMMIDSDTRLDNMTYMGAFKEVQYKYTLVNVRASQVRNDAINILRSQLINMACTTKDTRYILDNNIHMSYTYYDINGSHITKISVYRSDCR